MLQREESVVPTSWEPVPALKSVGRTQQYQDFPGIEHYLLLVIMLL